MPQSPEKECPARASSFGDLYDILHALPIAVSWARLPGTEIQFQNRAFDKLFGYPPDAFPTVEQFIEITYIHPEQRALARELWGHFVPRKATGVTEIPDIELEIRRFDGTTRMLRHCGVILHDTNVAIGVFEDISAQKQLTAMLNAFAHRDPLTGLANRRSLDERWQAEITAEDGHQRLAFLMIDLDGFKRVNDSHGHQAGDAVLRIVAARLQALVHTSDLVCRLGGDEFGLLLRVPEDISQVGVICDRIIATLQQPMVRDGVDIWVGVSVGGCLYPQQAADLDELVRRADQALYQVKATGKGRWGWTPPGLV